MQNRELKDRTGPRIVVLIVIAVALAMMLMFTEMNGAPDGGAWFLIGVSTCLFLGWLLFARWTWEQLQKRKDAHRIAYRFGALGWGLSFSIVFSLADAFRGVPSGTSTALLQIVFEALINFSIALPIALWIGYGMGLLIAGSEGSGD